MQAGKLNERAIIQQLASGQDALGQPVQTWSTVATVWANVRHLSGSETIRAGADSSAVKASIRIRHRSGLNAGMRVTVGSSVYGIASILPAERKVYIDLVCELVQ